MDLNKQPIVILDYGSQYTQVIARRVRELHVYCEIHSPCISKETLKAIDPCGIICSGGPESVTSAHHEIVFPKYLLEEDYPLLTICYGMQALIKSLSGQVIEQHLSEFGQAKIQITAPSALLESLGELDSQGGETLNVWMSHGDSVTELPENMLCVAKTEKGAIAAVEHQDKPWYGLQFHPEVTHTPSGKDILSRFVKTVCQAKPSWETHNIIEKAISDIREKVGQDQVVLALSGGVDSSVTALLMKKAIGERLTCLFVDNGLLRLNEVDEVMSTFTQNFGLKVQCIEAKSIFLKALKGVTDPEIKRKIIGETFIQVFKEKALQLGDIQWLAQGTIYPDIIESAVGHGKSAVIKSHHNVGGLPDNVPFNIIEPLSQLFKDEVRDVGEALGLPRALLNRHPFPGPGLGIRVLGEVTEAALSTLQQADHIYIQKIKQAGWYDKLSQAFAVFLPVKSVGVVGDARRHEPVIALRAVETQDFMTARWAPLPYDLLAEISNQIINEIPGVSRVTYDISHKPPATIEWE